LPSLAEIISLRLENEIFKKGVILDGYPRTVNQIKIFMEIRKIDMSIKIELDEGILIKKLTGRRECESCGRNYNLFSFKENGYDMDPLLSKVEGKCDECAGKLIQRSDDNILTKYSSNQRDELI
jgi:adenylate kinase